MKRITTNRGLVRTIVIIIIALLLLSYFGLNLRSIVDSPTFQENWAYVMDLLSKIWANNIKPALLYLWGAIFPTVTLPGN